MDVTAYREVRTGASVPTSRVGEPSAADKSLTEAIYLALGMVGVKLLDHFVFGEGGYQAAYSFAETGALH